MLAGVVGLVLLLACANVSAVQLARAQSRTRELTIRRVLGAGRGRLVRQLMTESALLAVLGGGAGLLVAWWGTNLLASYLPGRGLPAVLTIEPDRRVLAFTVAVSTFAALFVGMMPALFATRRETRDTLSSGGRVIAGRPRGAGRLLAAVQIALACVLLAGAVLSCAASGTCAASTPASTIAASSSRGSTHQPCLVMTTPWGPCTAV